MIRAVTFDPSTDAFTVSRLPEPSVSDPRDVLIQVDACGLNPVDAKITQWKSKAPGMNSQWVPGLDVSGRVVDVGADVTGWMPGDRVLCHGNMFRPHGGFAELTIQDAETLVPHPDVSSEIAAATPCAGWTAWRSLLDKLRIDQRSSLVILGGSGGVGSFAVQIAAHFGVERILATCSAPNREYVSQLGASAVIDYRNEDVVARVMESTDGEGVEAGLDTVGRDNDVVLADCLGFEGQMVELVDVVRPAEYRDAFMRGLSFHQFSLGSGHRHGPAAKARLRQAGQSFSQLLEKGELRVEKLRVVGLEEVAECLTELRKKRTAGKIVMKASSRLALR